MTHNVAFVRYSLTSFHVIYINNGLGGWWLARHRGGPGSRPGPVLWNCGGQSGTVAGFHWALHL
jgi:hypothetical protein